MIAHVRGTLAEKGIDFVVVDVGGVGLRLTVSLPTLTTLPPPGAPVELLTYLQVREDAFTLFGFSSSEERTVFEFCVSVQQVGPKLAMSILSTLDPAALAEAVRRGDHARLQRIPGVGRKTAERLVLELRDKFEKSAFHARSVTAPATMGAGTTVDQVVSALVNLGYRPDEAGRAVEEAEAGNPEATVELLLKKALQQLAE